jgi:AAHS family 4-hydroxybenzoate transporter-like MFS transporter
MVDKTINIASLIDDQPVRPFHVQLVVLIFLVMISDGYDQMSIGFAAPGIAHTLHIDRSSLGAVLSASLAGMLVGAPLLGWVGDRFGRRSAILSGVFIFGIMSFVSAAAQTFVELLVLRFVTGLGLSGVTANAVALIAEYAPKRVRMRLIVLAFIGLTVGSMLPAVVSGTLEAAYGWRSLFIVGGIAPLVIGVGLFFTLPESLKFMVVAKWPTAKLMRVASAVDPKLRGAIGLVFVSPEQTVGSQNSGIKRLFADGFVWITPIVWIIFSTYLAVNYFLHGWMPSLFRDGGLTIGQTAIVTSMYDVGGVIGAVTISRFVDRFGMAAIVALFLLACPAVGVIGFIGTIGHSAYLLGAVIFLSGFCLVGITLGMNAVAGVIYPTEIRASGVGWAFGVGRFGSISGPLIGGWLVGMNLPIGQLFLAPVVLLGVGLVLSLVLMQLCVKRFQGLVLSDAAGNGNPALMSISDAGT